MRDYVHHVPGRLRIAADLFKHDLPLVTAVYRDLSAMPGIASVAANRLTGSLTICYDADRLEPSAIARRVAALAGIAVHLPSRTDRGSPAQGTGWSGRVSKAVLALLLEKLLERSAARIIAALI